MLTYQEVIENREKDAEAWALEMLSRTTYRHCMLMLENDKRHWDSFSLHTGGVCHDSLVDARKREARETALNKIMEAR